jgi:putative hydrolase of the HAD superfamily
MLKAVIFDLDDTLIDWSGTVEPGDVRQARHLKHVFDFIGEQHPLDDLDAFIQAYRRRSSETWDASWTGDLRAPVMGEDLVYIAEQLGAPANTLNADALMRSYQWCAADGCGPFPETLEALTLLRDRGVKLGLVTNAYQPMWARDIELQTFELLDFFQDCRFSAADFGYLKPHPSIFQAVLGCLDVEPSEAVFVGDDVEADIVGAQAAGIFAVLRSSKRREQILNGTQPDSRIDSLLELPAILDSAFPGWGR